MATWKKVIVSGSQAELNSLTLDTALPVGSGGTGASTLTDGGVLLGSGTGAITALGQATNGQLVIGSTGADPVLATLTGGSNISITNTAGGIEIAATGLGSGTVQSVSGSGNVNGITLTSDLDSVDPVLTLGGTLGNIANSQLSSNGQLTLGSTTLELGVTTTTVAGLTSVTSTGFTGTLSATSILADGVTATTQTSGDNSTKVATTAYVDAVATAADLDLAGDGSTTTAVDLDSQTLTFTGNDGLQLSASAQTITATIANGGIANAKLANSTISGKALGTNLDNLTDGNGIVDFTYNGSSTATIVVQADSTTGGDTVPVSVGANGVGLNLTTIDGTGIGTSGAGELTIDLTEITVSNGLDTPNATTLNLDLTEVIATDGANRVLTSDGDGTLTAEPNFTFNGTDLTVTGNELITGNLVVQGTASFQHNEELQIADRFILMASGSTTAGDGGIVVQQDTQNVGELFAFDSGTTRWALDSAFDASNTAFTPEAFMAAAIEGAGTDPDATPARYDKKGNIFVGTDEGIWIYS